MRFPILTRAVVCALAASWLSAAAIAAESGAASSPDYRLRLDRPDAYRLTAREGYAPAPAPALGPAPQGSPASATPFADMPYAELIDDAARKAALDPALVHAVIYVESRYNPTARSPKGAIGLMQVLPETAMRYGIADPGHSPAVNLRAGTRYLSTLMEMFDGRLDLVLAAYNAGENAVLRHGQRIPPYCETRLYVPAVLAKYREWQQSTDPASASVTGSARVRTFVEYLSGTRLDPPSAATPSK